MMMMIIAVMMMMMTTSDCVVHAVRILNIYIRLSSGAEGLSTLNFWSLAAVGFSKF